MRPYTIDDLLYLMERLRDPDTGCPWDLKQDFATLVKHTIEETYEVVDAIHQEDHPHLCEELGDLLLQVIFYAQIAKEKKAFDWPAIVNQLVTKMVRRHPHVFPKGDIKGVIPASEKPNKQAIKKNWQLIKSKEKTLNNQQESLSVLSDIPSAIPAMQLAYKVQKKAASIGFDWPEVKQVVEKLKEETQEFEAALASNQPDQIQDELGDLFFTLVNLSRQLNLEPELVLRQSTDKFKQRFQAMENAYRLENREIEAQTLDEMEQMWQKIKNQLARE